MYHPKDLDHPKDFDHPNNSVWVFYHLNVGNMTCGGFAIQTWGFTSDIPGVLQSKLYRDSRCFHGNSTFPWNPGIQLPHLLGTKLQICHTLFAASITFDPPAQHWKQGLWIHRSRRHGTGCGFGKDAFGIWVGVKIGQPQIQWSTIIFSHYNFSGYHPFVDIVISSKRTIANCSISLNHMMIFQREVPLDFVFWFLLLLKSWSMTSFLWARLMLTHQSSWSFLATSQFLNRFGIFLKQHGDFPRIS